jgi:hypothetical protein
MSLITEDTVSVRCGEGLITLPLFCNESKNSKNSFATSYPKIPIYLGILQYTV